MKNIAERLAELQHNIRTLEQRYGRERGTVRLVAVSKTRSAEEIRAASGAGQHAFGENYLQEASGKIEVLGIPELEWHFIGPMQSNKTRLIAERFHWAHTVDRIKIAERLNAARPAQLPALNVCLQVNISGEHSKSGIAPRVAAELARAVCALPRLRLRGLMTLPAPVAGLDEQRAPFRQLRMLFEELRRSGMPLDTLSMGTTVDLEAAIAEGATLVRIGSAVFGPRRADAESVN